MRSALVAALLGVTLFSVGLSGVGQVDQQVAQADVAAQQAADRAAERRADARAVDCPWRDPSAAHAAAEREL